MKRTSLKARPETQEVPQAEVDPIKGLPGSGSAGHRLQAMKECE